MFIIPIIGKEEREEVINLLKLGYNIKETSEKTGKSRNYVSKIRKELGQKEASNKETSVISSISKESWQILYNLQGLFGKLNIDETIKQIGNDVRVIMPIKYKFDFDFEDTIGDVFKKNL